jgi:hypothetical protein
MPPPYVISLPSFVFENALPGYIGALLAAGDSPAITLDFKRIKYFIPGAIVATLAQVRHWHGKGQKVAFVNHDTNPVCGYLQRIDFFKHVGFELPEPGERRGAAGRFVPIEEINASAGKPDVIASKMAECVAPGGYLCNEPFQLVQYAGGEIVTNCKQHAHGAGFVSAQYSLKQDFARLAIADCGRGIRRSFEENNSPHFRNGMTDAEAITTALRPLVSSTTHLPHAYGASPNKGVGLSMVRELMQESLGHLLLISGRSWWWQDGRKPPQSGQFTGARSFQGTVCAVTFKREEIASYVGMLHSAKSVLGLTVAPPPDNLFL